MCPLTTCSIKVFIWIRKMIVCSLVITPVFHPIFVPFQTRFAVANLIFFNKTWSIPISQNFTTFVFAN